MTEDGRALRSLFVAFSAARSSLGPGAERARRSDCERQALG